MAVLTFPLFALSFTAAEPLIMLLFGERYVAAAPILSLLAVGQLIVTNALGAMTTVGVSVWLIPTMGALGAGVRTAAGQLLHTLLKQIALQTSTGVRALDGAYSTTYLTICDAAAVLLGTRLTWPENPWILVSAMAPVSLAVYLSARVSLSVAETFPELGRSRLLRMLLG